MRCVQRPLDPPAIAPPVATYAHGVVVESPSRWVHTSGVVPTAPDGSTPDDVGAQARVVWENLAAILAEADMGPDDVVSVVTYAVDGEDLAPVMAERDRFLGGRRAASTLVTVPRLAQDRWKVEVAVVAAR